MNDLIQAANQAIQYLKHETPLADLQIGIEEAEALQITR